MTALLTEVFLVSVFALVEVIDQGEMEFSGALCDLQVNPRMSLSYHQRTVTLHSQPKTLMSELITFQPA